MKKAILTILLLTCGMLCAFPRISVGEMFTASTCPACNSAHTFLIENQILWEDSAAVLRFHLSDGLSITECSQRYNYYDEYADSMGYIPHMFIDGEDYNYNYSNWINPMNAHALEGSFVGIEKAEHTSDSIVIRVFLDEPGHDGTYRLMAVLTVDGLSTAGHTYNWVVQRIYTSAQGNPFDIEYPDTLEFRFGFDADDDWESDRCLFVAYVLGPDLPTIRNAFKDTMYRRPDFEYETYTERRKNICAVGDTANLEMTIVNHGLFSDDYELSIIRFSMPVDWNVYMFSGDTATTVHVSEHPSESDIPIVIEAASPGLGSFGIVVHSSDIPEKYDTLFFTVGAGLEVLIVNDSQSRDSSVYVDFIEETGESYIYWDLDRDGQLVEFSTLGIEKVIWYSGVDTIEVLPSGPRTELRNYLLSMGGKVLLTGSGIGRLCGSDFVFYTMTLEATYSGVAPSFGTVYSLDGYEPLSGWNGTIMDIPRAEIIGAADSPNSMVMFQYGDGTNAGMIKQDGETRIAYIGFPLEAVTPHTAREDFMDKCFQFFDDGVGILEKHIPKCPALSVSPSPFNSSCRIDYSVFDESGVIEIMDISGRVVATQNISGNGYFKWTPQGVPAGLYLVRLSTDGEKLLTRTVFLK